MEAPVFITFCSDFNRMKQWLKINSAPDNFDNFMSFLIGMIDATLASQNIALAAQAEGLGICYMGTTMASNGEIAKVLNLPKNVVPVVGFSLGYPDELPEIRDRLPLEGILHYEKYRHYDDEEIRNIYKDRDEEGFKRYKSNKSLKKLIEQKGIKNLAQIYTELKYTEDSHLQYSADILKCLREQNFI